MADNDDEIKALATVSLRHKFLIDIILGVMNDFARFIEPTLQRCEFTRCNSAATVRQVDTHIKLCDHCAATSIYRSKRSLQPAPLVGVNLLRSRCADIDRWVDLPNAEQVRRLQEYVNQLKKKDEPEPPVDAGELH